MTKLLHMIEEVLNEVDYQAHQNPISVIELFKPLNLLANNMITAYEKQSEVDMQLIDELLPKIHERIKQAGVYIEKAVKGHGATFFLPLQNSELVLQEIVRHFQDKMSTFSRLKRQHERVKPKKGKGRKK